MENKYILSTSHIKAFNYGFSFFLLGQIVVPFIVEVFNYSFMLFVVTVDFFFFLIYSMFQ